MFRKIISSVLGVSMLCLGTTVPIASYASSVNIPLDGIVDDILSEQQLDNATDIKSPDEIPINEAIKDLDENVIKIMIDPGHYSYYNRSPVYSPYWESVMTWKLSNYLQDELQALGVHADLTKSSLDEDPSLNDRGFASKGYDFFISVHSNAGEYAYMDQPLAFVYQDLPWTTIDDTSKELGAIIAKKVSDTMGTSQKGATAQRKGTGDWDRNGKNDDEWYSVLFASRFVGTPGILMEHSFHTNYNSTIWLYNENNLKKLVKEEAKVIYDYFSKIKPQEYIGLIMGDVNEDEIVDASDASDILREYSVVSTGGNPTFSERSRKAADINDDSIVDSDDASAVLSFYSYLSTDGKETNIKKWILSNSEK